MSHFLGLVFTNSENYNLDKILAPFDEQNEEYMEFVDKTDEVKAEFEKLVDDRPEDGEFEEVIDMTDTINQIWDKAPDSLDGEESGFWQPYTKDKYPTPTDIAKDKGYNIIPDETKRDGVRFEQRYMRRWSNVPRKKDFPTIDKFAKDYCGYRKVNGRYGYMSNPNAKYDYYRNGWDSYLEKKDGDCTDMDFLTEIDWEKTVNENGAPFCFVGLDGVWYEKGEMGWWAMVSNEKKTADWRKEFLDYIDYLKSREDADEIEVEVLDFHI